LPETALREITAAAVERLYRPLELMVRQGDAPDGLLILLEGSAHARLHEADAPIGRFSRGDIVGEMALVTHEPRSADVIADTAVRALLVPTDAFDRLAVRHLELGMVLTELVADRLGRSARDGFGGKRIEDFRIIDCVGRGGMSVVYGARNERTGEVVALKMMSYRLIFDAAALARFRQEAELLQSLDHPNIARLQRLFPAYRTYFLVMELCEGVDLQALVDGLGPLPEARVQPMLGHLARALGYIHERGLVHRDLKPANVMLTRDGRLKLTDFGLAAPAVVHEDDSTRADPRLLGTPAFMAPEQLSGATVDRRADIYALGCLAFQLLAGRRLFNASNLFDLMQQKMTLTLPPREQIGGGVSAGMHAFLSAALHANPDDRPWSADAVAHWAAPCEPPSAALIRTAHP
jgi:serine/threonine protein kinase